MSTKRKLLVIGGSYMNLQMKIVSSLEKCFWDESLSDKRETNRFLMFSNERLSFQVGVYNECMERPRRSEVRLLGALAPYAEVRDVVNIPSLFPVDYNRTANDASNSEFDVEAGNKWADPGVISERIGASPYQPFPAIIISNYNTNLGLVHGTLSQRVFFHNYLVSHSESGVKLEIFS